MLQNCIQILKLYFWKYLISNWNFDSFVNLNCNNYNILYYYLICLWFSSLIKDHWNDKVSVAKNLNNFGLTNDPSKSILTGFINTQPQVQGEEIKIQNKKVSGMFNS